MEIFNAQQVLPAISKRMAAKNEETFMQKAQGPHAQKSGNSLEKSTEDFEALMLNKMLEEMRKTVPKSGLLESFSTDMYQSMMDQEMSKQLAKNGGIGLGKMLFKELSEKEARLAETRSKALQNAPKPEVLFHLDLTKDKK